MKISLLRHFAFAIVLTIGLVAIPSLSHAVDGVAIITQAQANSKGFPVIINQPGSYQLGSNLTTPANTSAITITVDNVTLNLNGFSILGGGGGNGIKGTKNITVVNGTVSGFDTGLDLANNSNIYKLNVSNNSIGLLSGRNSQINESQFFNNNYGIGLYQGSKITGSIISGNHANGIQTFAGVAITGNQITGNSGNGIEMVAGGIDAVIANNYIAGNDKNGVKTAGGVLLKDNVISGNTLYGLILDASNTDSHVTYSVGYGNNVFLDNNGGGSNAQVFGDKAIEIGTNVCGGGTVCK